MHSNMYMGISPTETCIIDRAARTHMYLSADSQLVTVSAPMLVAKGIPIFELTKLKSVTTSAIQKQEMYYSNYSTGAFGSS